MKRTIKISIMAILLATLAVTSISIYTGWSLVHPERKIPVFVEYEGLNRTDVTFKDIQDEYILKGWLFEASNSTKTVIFSHGYRGSRTRFGKDSFILFSNFVENGYNVLAFDYRNCGESEDAITSVGVFEKNDLLGAIDFMRSRGTKEIVLIGHSMGAVVSIGAAIEEKEIVKAIIADSPFADLKEYLEEKLPVWSELPHIPFTWITLSTSRLFYGIELEKVSPINSVSELSDIPILLIHSTKDTKISIEDSQKIYSKSPDNIDFWKVEYDKHGDAFLKDPAAYIERINEFLEKIE